MPARRGALVLAALLAPCAASAQGFDSHGLAVPPDGPSTLDPTWSWSPALAPTGACSLGAELAESPLVQVVVDGDRQTRDPLVQQVYATEIACAGRVHDRVGLGFAAPLYLASTGPLSHGGVAPGDLQLWAPVNVLSGNGSVDVIATLALPTGPEERYLGDAGAGGGLLVAGGFGRERFSLTGNLGLVVNPPTDLVGWSGGAEIPFAFGFGFRSTTNVALLLETRGTLPLDDAAIPMEGRLAVKAKASRNVWITAAAGPGIAPGVGSAFYRVHAAVGVTPGKRPSVVEPSLEGFVQALLVYDEEGHVVRGARVSAGRREYATDVDGLADLPGIRRTDVLVQATGFKDHVIPDLGEEEVVRVVLERAPVAFAIRVVDPDGRPVQAAVTIEGPAPVELRSMDEVGTRNYELEPGTWTVTAEAPGFGPQVRTIEVAPERVDAMRVDAVLTPVAEESSRLVVRVHDPEQRPVEGAMVKLGGRVVGTTGSGGDLAIESLPAGPIEAIVESEDYAASVPYSVTIDRSEPVELDVELGWRIGSVVLSAVDFEGRPTEAWAEFRGPSALPRLPLGADGERLFLLTPGRWTVLLSSPTLGSQERDLEVVAAPGHVQRVVVSFLPDEAGEGSVVLHVRDPDGFPMPSAWVHVDGKLVGATSSLGTIGLFGLEPGSKKIDVAREYAEAWSGAVDVVEGSQSVDVVVGWKPGTVRIAATEPDGSPQDALVTPRGPAKVAPVQLGPDGVAWLSLPPGTWDLTAEAEGLAAQTRGVDVAAEGDRLVRVDIGLRPPVAQGKLELVVKDPDGKPVADAEVVIDGVSQGRTSNTGTIEVDGVAAKSATIEVSAPGLATQEQTVAVAPEKKGQQAPPTEVTLDWAPGAVRVKVEGSGDAAAAVVTVTGPEEVAPQRVGADGEAVVALTPGTWYVQAATPTHGTVEQQIVVAEDGTVQVEEGGPVRVSEDGEVREVALALEPVGEGAATLRLRVVDAEGAPVAGVAVSVDGKPVGTTSAGGLLVASKLAAGPHAITLTPSQEWLPEQFDLTLREGASEHHTILSWRTSPVTIAVVDEQGQPIEAAISFEGPSQVVGTRAADSGDPSSEAPTFELRPGEWTVFATADGRTVGTATVEVKRGGKPVVTSIALQPDDAPQAVVTERTIDVRQTVPFAFDDARLGPGTGPILDEIATLVRSNPRILRLEIQGHTDDVGTVAYNLDLSNRRAESVRAALIARGVAPERLVAVGYGVLRPLVPNTDEASRARNRRVEFVIVEAAEAE